MQLKAVFVRRIIIISRVLDFCRRTFGGKATKANNQKAQAVNKQQAQRPVTGASLLPAELNDNSVKQQLLFKNLMAEPLQHAELTVGNSGCLAVVGKDREQQRCSLIWAIVLKPING